MKTIDHYSVDPGETVETADEVEESMEGTEVAVISEAQTDCSSLLCSTSLPFGGDKEPASNSDTQLSNPGHPNQDLNIPSDLSQDKMGKPVQPRLCFPTRSFGSCTRAFQASWYSEHSWMEYSQERDAAFCFCCRFFNATGIPVEPAFTKIGFRDWKHACGRKGSLALHVASHAHKAAMLNWQQFNLNMARGTTVGARLDQEGRRVISNNRHYVKTLAESILLCAQQGIALRGHGDNMDDSSKNAGNFKAIVKLLSKHDETVRKRLEEGPRNATFLGHAIQNELLAVMARMVMEKIQAEIHEAKYYTIIADETKDISKKEQLSIVLRYVHQGRIHERFVGYIHATQLNATALSEYILQIISEMQLDIKDGVSQCYDGASVMSGKCAGVSAKILEKNAKAVYIHCCAHRLNLALVDMVKAIPAAEDFFCMLQALYVFMSASKAHEIFLEQQRALNLRQEVRLQKLSDTRWACQYMLPLRLLLLQLKLSLQPWRIFQKVLTVTRQLKPLAY